MKDSITDATKHFVLAPSPYKGQCTTGGLRGVWLAGGEDVEWIKNANGDAIGCTITKTPRSLGLS